MTCKQFLTLQNQANMVTNLFLQKNIFDPHNSQGGISTMNVFQHSGGSPSQLPIEPPQKKKNKTLYSYLLSITLVVE